ncbi:glycosyltransferase family 90 protein [Calocera cornea HHB12733]|uniref:Glycosyltransferase family 90 protein n=1 Tax=Calocera cornea HHB12733 TaxID=1353952 RepID=A0A165FGG3_9BASI|nr:glycosyltransferase family 90 protein [Calocera cornea HHB12733]
MDSRSRSGTASSGGRPAMSSSSPRLELGTVPLASASPSPAAGSQRTPRAHYHRHRPQRTLTRITLPFTTLSIALALSGAPHTRPLTSPSVPHPPLPAMRSPKPPSFGLFAAYPQGHNPRTRIPALYIRGYYTLLSLWRRTRLARTLLISAGIILLFFRVLTTPPPPPRSTYSRIPVLPLPLDANPSALGARGPLEPHTYLPSGLVVVNPRGRHPIYELVERAQREWEEKNARASKTLEQAVREYQRRYGRWPPRGFDKWWAYVERHNVQLPDEYDQILADLVPYYAYSPRELRALQAQSPLSAAGNNRTFTLSSSRLHSTLHIARAPSPAARERAESALDVLTGDGESWMPDPGYVDNEEWEASMEGIGVGSIEIDLMGDAGSWDAVFSTGREPGVVVSEQWADERRRAIKSDRFMRMTGRYVPNHRTDTPWPDACPSNSAIHPGQGETLSPQSKSFIYSPELASSPCANPALIPFSPLLNRTARADMALNDPHTPLFSTCKSPQVHGDVLVPDGSHWVYRPPKDVPWAKKREARLVWRGRPSEDILSSSAAQSQSQKPMPHAHRGKRPAMLDQSLRRSGIAAAPPAPRKHQVLLPSHASEPVGEPVERLASWLEKELADGPFPGWDVRPLDLANGAAVEDPPRKKKDDWRVLANVVDGKLVYVNESEPAGVTNRTADGSEGRANGTSAQNATKAAVKDNSTALELPTEWELLERNNQYKYVLDIDDQSCSPSFRHLLATGALVLKATAFEEWYADRVQPWVHYVPVQLDLSDLYDALSFFRGDVAHGGEGAHDALAAEIAGRGKEWTASYWRREDMTAYMYRLFLEYGRLMSDDRDKMNFYMTQR